MIVSQSVVKNKLVVVVVVKEGERGPSAISLLFINLWCLRVGCRSRTNVLYSCGVWCCIVCHVRAACS